MMGAPREARTLIESSTSVLDRVCDEAAHAEHRNSAHADVIRAHADVTRCAWPLEIGDNYDAAASRPQSTAHARGSRGSSIRIKEICLVVGRCRALKWTKD